MHKLISTFLLLLFSLIVSAQDFDPDIILGTWIPKKGDSHVKIEKIGSKYFGKVVWLENPNEKDGSGPDLDNKNPDPALRSVPIMGLRVLKGFSYEGKKKFKGGTAYDPNNGKTYCGKITILDEDHIDMRGHLCGFGILGRTETWIRYKGD